MASKVLLSPSILSADFGRLAQEIREVEQAGVDWVHVDVMDGNFVPNMTVGPNVVRAVKRATSLPVDVHLMVVEAGRYVEAFAKAGADIITVHVEACTHLQRVLQRIRDLGKRPAVALNPHTDESSIRYVLDDLDMVLVMSVNPGFGAQTFIPSQLEKIRRVAEMIRGSGRSIEVQVDGGVSPSNARQLVDAGATVLVAGAAIFGQEDRPAAVRAFRTALSS